MNYEAPEMDVVSVSVDAAIADDHEVDFDMGDFLSKGSMPK